MGVRANLLAVTLIAADTTTAEAAGIAVKGEVSLAVGALNDAIARLNFINTYILTPAGDSANQTIFTTALTALN
jgi:hypothetical protein